MSRERIIYLSMAFDAVTFPGVTSIKVIGHADGPQTVGGLASFLTCTHMADGRWSVAERIPETGDKLKHGSNYSSTTVCRLIDHHRTLCQGLIAAEIITND